MHTVSTEVLMAGAGPLVLTLALDLGRRVVRCTLIERNAAASRLPKMERCTGRTMEIYRRLGVATAVRGAGLAREAPMDIFLTTSLMAPRTDPDEFASNPPDSPSEVPPNHVSVV